jgi:hypothetical protein
MKETVEEDTMKYMQARTYTREQRLAHKSVVGKVGTISIDELEVAVKVHKERFRYGRLDVLVRPIVGSGTKWVEFHKIKIERSR